MKKIFTILTIFIFTIAIYYPSIVLAYIVPEQELIVITHNGEEKTYEDIYEAMDALQDGDTIKFLVGLTNSYFKLKIGDSLKFDDDVTVDFNKQNLDYPIVVEDGATVKFINGVNQCKPKPTFTFKDNTDITIDGGSYILDSGTVMNIGSNVNLKVNDATIWGSYIFNLQGSGATVDFDNVDVQANPRQAFVVGENAENNTVNINGGKVSSMYGILSFENTSKNNKFYFNDVEELGCDMTLKGENNSVVLNNVNHHAAQSDFAVEIKGINNSYTVNGNSSVEAGMGAIYTDSDTAKVVINGGTIRTHDEYTEYNRLTPVIISKQSKEIVINGGTIIGQVGILALGGNVKINGGSIIANNEDPDKYIVYSDYRAFNPLLYNSGPVDYYGASVIVDSDDAKVTVTGGNFSATTSETLVSVRDKVENYSVSGGIYNKPFNEEFVVEDKVELTITNNDSKLWYVGTDALNAVEKSKTDATTIIDVLQGDLEINNAKAGVQVTNSSDGKVSVNGTSVEKGQTVVADPMPEQTNDDIANADTSDNILLYILAAIVSIFGLIFCIKSAKSN